MTIANSRTFGKCQSRYCDDCAAPEGTPPRRFNYLKTLLLTYREPFTYACRTFTIFHD